MQSVFFIGHLDTTSLIQAHFSHPMVAAAVIIHLAADGTGYIDQTQCNVTVQLVDTKEGIHSLGKNLFLFQCSVHTLNVTDTE